MGVTFRINKGKKAWAKGLSGIKSPKARSGKGLRILKPGKCRPGKGLRDIYHGEIQWAWAIQQMLFCVWQWW